MGRLWGKGASCCVLSPGRQLEWRACCRPRERACAGMHLGGGVGAQPCSPLRPPQSSCRSGKRLSLIPSPPAPTLKQGTGVGIGGRSGCFAGVERGGVPAGGLAQCAAGQGFDLARAPDPGQTLVAGPAQVVPGAQLAPVLRTPGLKSRSLGLQMFWERNLKSCPVNGTLRAPPTSLSFEKASYTFLS